MKKRILMTLFFSFCLPVQLGAQSKVPPTRWQLIKARFDREVIELKKCVKNDRNCDPLRRNLYITAAILMSILTGYGIKKAVKYYTRVPVPTFEGIPQVPPVVQPQPEQAPQQIKEQGYEPTEEEIASWRGKTAAEYEQILIKARQDLMSNINTAQENEKIFGRIKSLEKLHADARQIEQTAKEKAALIEKTSTQYKQLDEQLRQELSTIRSDAKKTAEIYRKLQAAEQQYRQASRLSGELSDALQNKKLNLIQEAVKALEN